ncbi:MAG: alpha/beta hydrolase [Chloroflexi bacterium HGW-Chloroflexi-4]|jgi:hypothetical protein|nr:MAG: alpha/beta hydrolase [Chloroflexi bacterium HGW-Chloroflexi-4]
MLKTILNINNIPAALWGAPADRLIIAVHGMLGSKDDFDLLAEIAGAKGFQVLSFDLPEHGGRKNEGCACNPPNAVKDLMAVMHHAQTLSDRISLYACSLGAWFSLLAYQDTSLEQCLFQSPVVDMPRLIKNMMKAAGVREERLQAEKLIANPYGPPLEWEYYHFAKTHPIDKWGHPTAILMGAEDETSEVDVVKGFAARFNAGLALLEGSRHYLHTENEIAEIRKWLNNNF